MDLINKFNKFNIINIFKKEHEFYETIEAVCKTCDTHVTKKVNSKNSCRVCSIRNKANNKEKIKLKQLKIDYPEIINWEKRGQNYKVTYNCKYCNNIKSKLLINYINDNRCTNCVKSESTTQRVDSDKSNRLILLKQKISNICNYFKIDNFKNTYSNIEIECNGCGVINKDKIYRVNTFIKEGKKYLCKSCTHKEKIEMSSYNMVKFYTENTDLGLELGYLYMYEIKTEYDIGYKIGITRNSIKDRLRKVSKLYEIKNICFIQGTNLDMSILEKELKQKYKDYKIKPEQKFEGYTECFNLPILLEEKIEVQRLSLDGSTSQADGGGSGQPL